MSPTEGGRNGRPTIRIADHEVLIRCWRLLGALLDALVHLLRAIGGVQLDRLPRMADFAIWATACETALWPAGTFARAYATNRRAAIESIIEADPIATCVRALMVDRSISASSLCPAFAAWFIRSSGYAWLWLTMGRLRVPIFVYHTLVYAPR